MNTSFEEIYPLFFAQIDDYTFAQADEDAVLSELEKYLSNSYLTFYSIMQDLDIDLVNKQFSRQLVMIEKLMIAKAMAAEWLLKKLNSEELMVKAIGDRDYNAVQGFGYLKQLRAEYDAKIKDLDRSKIDYTYLNEEMSSDLFNG